MREGSREQTGCFAATLMLASAAFTLKAVFRRAILQPDARLAARALHATQVFGLLAIVLTACAFLALKLRRSAFVFYFAASAVGAAYDVAAGSGWSLTIPILIGVGAVSALLFARRDVI